VKLVVQVALAIAGILIAVRVHVGDAHYKRGRPERDRPARTEWLERAEQVDSGDALYPFRLGRALLERGTAEDLDRAVECFRRAARRNPVMARAQYWWGVACERLGREEEALSRYRAARRLAPNNLDLNKRVSERYAARWARTRDPEDLRRAFEALHALRLVEPRAVTEGVLALLRRPVLRYADLDSVIPMEAEPRRTLAETLAAAERHRWAVRTFDQADRLANAGGRLSMRGRILWYEALRDGGLDEAALRKLLEAREAAPEAFDRPLDLARAYLRVGKSEEARETLRQHLRTADDVGAAGREVHEVFGEIRRSGGAKLELEFWKSVRPGYPTVAVLDLYQAEAASACGNDEACLGALRRYLIREPASDRAYYLAAVSFRRLGQRKLAQDHLRQALRLRPSAAAYRRLAVDLGMEHEL
jgi:tetratricopeptide (TPR) repeat protein